MDKILENGIIRAIISGKGRKYSSESIDNIQKILNKLRDGMINEEELREKINFFYSKEFSDLMEYKVLNINDDDDHNKIVRNLKKSTIFCRGMEKWTEN